MASTQGNDNFIDSKICAVEIVDKMDLRDRNNMADGKEQEISEEEKEKDSSSSNKTVKNREEERSEDRSETLDDPSIKRIKDCNRTENFSAQTPRVSQENLRTQHEMDNFGFVADSQNRKEDYEASLELELTHRASAAAADESPPRSPKSYVGTHDLHRKRSKSKSFSPLWAQHKLQFIHKIQDFLRKQWQVHCVLFCRLISIILVLLYLAYFSYAMYYRFGDEGSIVLLAITAIAAFGLMVTFGKKFLWNRIKVQLEPLNRKIDGHGSLINWIVVLLIILAILIFIIVDVVVISKNPYNLVSGSGILIYVFLFFIFSRYPTKIRWQTVVWGFALQLVFALFILRTEAGFKVFEWLGSRVTDFFSFSDEGSKFVFGEEAYLHHFFAFKVMPTVIFFSTAVSVLYHLGVMQFVISKVAWVMQITMATTAGESLTAAANIFIGQTEAPLLIGPLLPDMTASEMHAVMTGGFATITGGIMAAYILLGVPANHLISASVMSAPAALAMSKLIFPETEESKTTVKHLKTALHRKTDDNVIGALSSGASASIKIVANVIVNLIAFIATLHLLNAILTWFGQRVGIEELTFQLICSYVLWPFAFIMGVESVDCRKVAQLIGIKTILNEFIAYTELGDYINNRELFDAHVHNNGSWYSVQDAIYLVNDTVPGNATVLVKGILSDRSIAISTYALCGFSNIGSMGIVLGAMSSMAPTRKKDLASSVLSAMIAGNVACFITACIAGLFYTHI